jgi:hypothetical protein
MPRKITPTGERIRIDMPGDRIPPYDPRSGNHLWIVTGMWQVDPVHWHSPDPTVTPMLDGENLLTVVGPGCYHCENLYTPALARRRCTGEPR